MIITWVLDILEICLANSIILNPGSFFSPAAYKGHRRTKLDFEKDFENSFFNE